MSEETDSIKLTLTKDQANSVVEALLFSMSADVCSEWKTRHLNTAYIVAKKIVEIEEGKTKLEQNYSLEKIYIFDIDGTVSLMNGRGAFEYHKVDTDSPNEPVISILRDYLIPSGIRILYLSGREDVCLEKTKLWLHKQGILSKYDVDTLNGTNVGQFGLFMRKTGDNRDDRIVKKEMFDNYIKDKYYVKAVYDDRPKVIRMWRELGLFVFDVGDGHEF